MEPIGSQSWVRAQTAHNMSEWRRCAGSWCHSTPRFTEHNQRMRESAYDRGLRAVERCATSPSASGRVQQKLIASFARFAAEALDLGHDSVKVLTKGFLPVGIELARWARRFDPSLSNADILQASRNAWTACGLQPLLGARLGLTPAILGYSLIYPYSDNFLDQQEVPRSEKLYFVERFERRLRGDMLPPANSHERSLWRLVLLIEQQFPRSFYPIVFDSLLAIHRAQCESIAQINSRGSLEEDMLLRISCSKGGTSVLADAFLAHGHLTAEQAEFAFKWGILLQLGDDLQDIAEDLRRESDTLFTRAVRAGQPLDELVSQLLNFSDVTGKQLDVLTHGDTSFKYLLRMSWRSLVIMAVAQYPAFFTTEFSAYLESHSPFRFAFLRARRERLAGKTGLFEILFQIILAGQSEDRIAVTLNKAGVAPHLQALAYSATRMGP